VDMAGGSVWDCLPYLTNLKENYRQDTGQTYVTGNAGNLRVGVSERGVSITGSLAKFYLGTNLHTLTRSDSRRAFEQMADTLHLPIHKAKVTKIEAGQNIITNYKPELYYSCLGQSKNYTRSTFDKTLYYHNGQRIKKAYNKIAESKHNKVPIPEVYVGNNVLRFEVSYIARLSKQFNQALITPITLTDERFYMAMYERWFNEYEVIDKVGLFNMDTSKIHTIGDYKEQLLRMAVQEKGLEVIFQHIEVMKEQKVFKHASYYSNLKNEMKEMLRVKNKTEQPELLQELNKKVARAKAHYR
jgi:hypothetical protein